MNRRLLEEAYPTKAPKREIKATNDKKLAADIIEALVYSLISISPGGKQNSHASRALASYVLAERGPVQPRSLAVAYLKPVRGENLIQDSIDALVRVKGDFDAAYPFAKPEDFAYDVHHRKADITQLVQFCRALPELKV
jgi:CRISPR system Cascade subunit CasC